MDSLAELLEDELKQKLTSISEGEVLAAALDEVEE